MQWKTISTQLGSTVYGLWNDGHQMLTLACKGKCNTLYMEAKDGDKRLFHYRKKGIFKNKPVIENEYGVDLGKLQKEGEQEYIQVDEKRYFLNYSSNHKQVQIMDEETEKPIATCNLEIENPNDTTQHSLLMVACLLLKKAYSQPQSLSTEHYSFS